nr:sulfatase-like hydrolase/transferase [Halomicroarcula sp. SHR3]
MDKFLPDDVTINEMNAAVDANHVGRTITGKGFDERERQILQGLYDGTISYLDDQIKSFYRFLEAEGELENTVFIVLADHGDLFGEWNLWGHQGRIHNRLCHVPLLIRYPWGDGHREDGVTELRQLFDHLTRLGKGVDPDQDPYMKPQGEALTEYYGLDTQVSITPWEEYSDATRSEWGSYQASLVRDNWRLLEDVSTGPALYDVVADPSEERNVVENNEDVRTEMRERIVSLVGHPEENHKRYRGAEGDESFGLDQKTVEHLEELGYM